jgi:hypothetical protein
MPTSTILGLIVVGKLDQLLRGGGSQVSECLLQFLDRLVARGGQAELCTPLPQPCDDPTLGRHDSAPPLPLPRAPVLKCSYSNVRADHDSAASADATIEPSSHLAGMSSNPSQATPPDPPNGRAHTTTPTVYEN